ncbi:hypothetical protein BKA67DRAFT_517527, partial [Truncatella angustata]
NDEEEIPKGPVKTVDKTQPRTTKRNVEPVAPAAPATANTGRRGPGGNEGAFRDRNAGHSANQRRTTEEASRGGPRGGRGARQRGGRGGGYPRDRDDRHARGLPGSEKQGAQSWGAQEGEAEQKDEQAGEAIAQTELKEAVVEDAQAPETPVEPEEKKLSYDEYLAQQAEKKAALGGDLEVRKANEGTKTDKKWSNAKALTKEEGEDFIASSGGKTKRERERKQKQTLDIDHTFQEQNQNRGDRRAPRGDRGGDRGDRGEGRGRGGQQRGGRNENVSLNPTDERAFPSLGA